MKYPKQQFELLTKALKVLSAVYENIKDIHPCQIQYLLYQQASEGQKHNALYKNNQQSILKGYAIKDDQKSEYKPLIDFLNEDNFPLYPEGCNDNHIETAVKAAIKLI